MEDVPGALLGVLPRWWLFPETVWGSAQLICSWSNRLSFFCNLQFSLYPPTLFSSICLAIIQVEPPLPNNRFYTQLPSSPVLGGTPCPAFSTDPLLPPPSPSCFSLRQSNGHFTRTSSALFLECFKDFVHRKVKILCLRKKKKGWQVAHHRGFWLTRWLLCFFWFYIHSDKQKKTNPTTTTQENNGASRKEKAKDSHVRKICWKTFKMTFDTQGADLNMILFMTFDAHCMKMERLDPGRKLLLQPYCNPT